MSQLTTVRTASRTAGSTQWWHLTLTTGGFDVADGIVEELVTPLVAQARALGAKRWYFSRSGDPATQVQVNIQAHPRVLDKLQGLQRDLNSTRNGARSKITVRQHTSSPAADLYYFGGTGEPDPQLEADLITYGGTAGLELAEQIFELSSELGLWAVQRFARMQSRSALGAMILFDSAQAMMRGPRSGGWPERRRDSWDSYWDNHLAACTAELGVRGAAVREAMAEQVRTKSPAFHCLMGATAAEASVQHWRRRWFQALDGYLSSAEKAGVGRGARHLTVYQAHMTINRMGFVPREEAALGLHARSWNPQSPAGPRRRQPGTT
ncbi:lantibiotic dehydratase C-terminal domain-containing protein [Arthrobacter sp. TMN-37]